MQLPGPLQSALQATRLCLQVHRAVLHSGEEVVVKIQRPGLKALIDIALANLKVVAQQLDRKEDSTTDFV